MTTKSQEQNNLLNKATAIQDKYESISNLSGENFNLFQIVNLQTSEVRLHSAFLGNLLSPKGTHGQGDIFLRLFIKRFAFKEGNFDAGSARVEIEKHIGFLNEEKTEGGRIDLLITDLFQNQIIIENKIYAPDQLNQLYRYHRYNPKADLFYLCLDGEEVPQLSKNELTGSDFRILTYERDVTEWLTECKKEVVDQPIIREGISQYINLIKHLTGHTLNHIMNKELVQTITESYEKFEAAFDISNALDSACDELLRRFEVQIGEIAKELNLSYEFNINLDNRYSGFSLWRDNWNSLSIGFQFQGRDTKLIYGLQREEECPDMSNPLTMEVARIFSPLTGQSSTWWPFYRNMESPFDNWSMNMKAPWLAIIDGSLKKIVKDKISEVLLYADKVQGI